MGREKEYRQRLKYQVSSVKRKSLETQIAVQFMNELGMSPVESRLLARRMRQWLMRKPGFRGHNQIAIEASRGRGNFVRNGKASSTSIKITPYEEEDLDLELEYGLKTMQAGRISRLIEQSYDQDALLSIKQLTLLTNITPTSLRGRLVAFRNLGIYLPLVGLSKKAREAPGMLRSTWVLSRYLAGESVIQIRREAAISKGRFNDLLVSFSSLAFELPSGTPVSKREFDEWLNLLRSSSKSRLKEMLPARKVICRLESEDEIEFELRAEYGMAPVKIRAVMQILRELKETMSENRPSNTVIYWAVAATESAGKPLDVCALVPVKLRFIDPEDVPDSETDRDFNCVSNMKFNKAVRYATQAKYCGGYLTYSDLGYLLGIHPAAISGLLQKHSKIIIPLRGSECDIGRGVSHRKEIIKLFLEMYTETQIASRTGHSYEAIENYIKEFACVMILDEQGLSVPMIRKVMGRSTGLIQAYVDLLREYSKPEYSFRLSYLRRLGMSGDILGKKKSSEHHER